MDASRQSIQTCGGRQVTQVGDDGPAEIYGTGKDRCAGGNARDKGRSCEKGKL